MTDLPRRLLDLDPRTIEMLARLNEDERKALIELAGLDDEARGHLIEVAEYLDAKKRDRLKSFLSLPDEKFQAGFDIVTRSVVVWKVIRALPWFVGALVVFITSLIKLWEWFSPYLRLGGKG